MLRSWRPRTVNFVRSFVAGLLGWDPEVERLRRILGGLVGAGGTPPRVLDVGCGYGRNLRVLREVGCEAVGVEVNPDCIAAIRAEGFRCLRPEELDEAGAAYDVILMSHIIEHFAPQDLFVMMDSYLDRLRTGGHLIVLTPLISPYFFDDFDHVKPYQPAGLLMVFGAGNAQVQYRSRNRLVLSDIWFRRGHWKPTLVRSLYLRSSARFLWIGLEILSALLFRVSGTLVGRKDGWLGVFTKVAPTPDNLTKPHS